MDRTPWRQTEQPVDASDEEMMGALLGVEYRSEDEVWLYQHGRLVHRLTVSQICFLFRFTAVYSPN